MSKKNLSYTNWIYETDFGSSLNACHSYAVDENHMVKNNWFTAVQLDNRRWGQRVYNDQLRLFKSICLHDFIKVCKSLRFITFFILFLSVQWIFSTLTKVKPSLKTPNTSIHSFTIKIRTKERSQKMILLRIKTFCRNCSYVTKDEYLTVM